MESRPHPGREASMRHASFHHRVDGRVRRERAGLTALRRMLEKEIEREERALVEVLSGRRRWRGRKS